MQAEFVLIYSIGLAVQQRRRARLYLHDEKQTVTLARRQRDLLGKWYGGWTIQRNRVLRQ